MVYWFSTENSLGRFFCFCKASCLLLHNQKRAAQGQLLGSPDIRGDGEYIMKIRRFLPDFITQAGDTRITLFLRNYPNNSAASSSLGPFTITSSTDKVDTRARARAIALKVENTSTSQNWKLGTFRLDIQPDGRR